MTNEGNITNALENTWQMTTKREFDKVNGIVTQKSAVEYIASAVMHFYTQCFVEDAVALTDEEKKIAKHYKYLWDALYDSDLFDMGVDERDDVKDYYGQPIGGERNCAGDAILTAIAIRILLARKQAKAQRAKDARRAA